ncbi:MAG: DUF1549 domain-containing protein [Polyangiaceae bacterium]
MRAKMITLLSVTALMAACSGEHGGQLGNGSSDTPSGGDDTLGGDGRGSDPTSTPEDPALAARVVDFNEALRTASLKLTRRLPTLAQIGRVAEAGDPQAAYEAELDQMLQSPAFSQRMVKLWRDAMRMGGDGLDSAPVLAAQLMVENRPFTELFTATTGNCPTYDAETHTFAAADCASGAPVQAGVLTDPAVMRQFYGNMAFRRVRWVQEVFFCSKFPAEVADEPVEIDGKDYTSPWAFESIASAPIDFQDTESVVCANCHTSINHLAPLFGNFDADGMWQAGVSVLTPIAPQAVPTELSHWLQPGETTQWRKGNPVADLAELGQAIAGDPALGECMVARMWNWALSKEDIVTDLATVPYGVLEPHVVQFDAEGDLKATLRSIMVSRDFVSF